MGGRLICILRAHPVVATLVSLIGATVLFVGSRIRSIPVAGGGAEYGPAQGDIARFLAFALCGIALVSVGRRWGACAPVISYVFAPLVAGFQCGPVYDWYSLQGTGHIVSLGSVTDSSQRWCVAQAAPLRLVAVDFALVMIPAAVCLLSAPTSNNDQNRGTGTSLTVRTSLIVIGLVVTVGLAVVLSPSPISARSALGLLLPMFIFGALLSLRDMRWAWTLIAVPTLLLLSQKGVSVLWEPGHYNLGIVVRGLLSLVAATCLGALGATTRLASGRADSQEQSVAAS